MSLALVLLLIAMQSDKAGPSVTPKVLSICEILAGDPTRLNGKILTVRGVLAGTDEGSWLVEDCNTHLVTKGLTWANSFSIYADLSDAHIAASWQRMLERVRRLRVNAERDSVWITVVGRLETRASMDDEVVQMPYGLSKAGFGHIGEAPAEINVISVKNVVLERGTLSNRPHSSRSQ
jgi:hypothetical protein